MTAALDHDTQHALLSTLQLCLDNGAHFSSLAKTLDEFIIAFDLTAAQSVALQQVKKNFEEGKALYELFQGCDALDKPVAFFLTLPYSVYAGRWSDSFTLALRYLERRIKASH
jgi:hypothetical protein